MIVLAPRLLCIYGAMLFLEAFERGRYWRKEKAEINHVGVLDGWEWALPFWF